MHVYLCAPVGVHACVSAGACACMLVYTHTQYHHASMRHNYLHEMVKLMENKGQELSGEKSIFSSPQLVLQANRGCRGIKQQGEMKTLGPLVSNSVCWR